MKKSSVLPYTLATLATSASAGFIFSFMQRQNAIASEDYPSLCLLFLAIALALPVPFGWIADRAKLSGRIFAVCGLGTVAIGMFIGEANPLLTAIIAGIGCGAVGLGCAVGVIMGSRGFSRTAICLSVIAVGFTLGEKLGEKEFLFSPYHFVIVLLFVAGAVWCFCDAPRSEITAFDDENDENDENGGKKHHLGTILKAKVPSLICLLAPTLLLAFASTTALHPESDSSLAFILPSVAVFGGIIVGGFLSDLIGARRTGAFALLLSSPLLVLGAESFLFYLAGIMLLSTSASILTVSLVRLLPLRTGLGAGLLSLAASVGFVLSHLLSLSGTAALAGVAVISMASAVLVFITTDDTHIKRK